MAKMNALEMTTFLEGSHIANLVTLYPDGTPDIAPIWYEFRENMFLMFTPSNSRKLQNLAIDNRASISIASYDEPYRYVVAEGYISLDEQSFEAIGLRIATRYRGSQKGEAFVNQLRNEYKMVTLMFSPERLITYKAA